MLITILHYDAWGPEGAKFSKSNESLSYNDVLTIYIKDNGTHDSDDRLGVIRDPGYVGYTPTKVRASADERVISAAKVNEAPTISGASSTLSFTEGDSASIIDNSLTISDSDDFNIESASVSISSNYQSGSDVLGFSNTSDISGNWKASSGVLSLTGSASLSSYENALESDTFENVSIHLMSTLDYNLALNDGDSDSLQSLQVFWLLC